jgi:LysR family carnitine catabolism transcriptional activator
MFMNLHQLRIFLAVARLRSFTQAADHLHLSQPDISLHVRELEQEKRAENRDLPGG